MLLTIKLITTMNNNTELIELVLIKFLDTLKDRPELSIEDIKSLQSLSAQGKLNDASAISDSLKKPPAQTK